MGFGHFHRGIRDISHLYDISDFGIEMETNKDEPQAGRNGTKESQTETKPSCIPSVTSMDLSRSITSASKDVKPKPKSSISELVGKSKKAAFSLWTLLHAKVGRMYVFEKSALLFF